VYFVDSPDYVAFMDAQQEIYLQLVDRFAASGIEFAAPTQTLQVRDGRSGSSGPGGPGGLTPLAPASDPKT
jgi:hypothetical protein